MILSVLALIALAIAPLIVGAVLGAIAASDKEREENVEERIENARERIRAATARGDFVDPADQAEINRLLQESEARLERYVHAGVREAYAWCWATIVGAVTALAAFFTSTRVADAWPLAFAWAALGYGLLGAPFDLPPPTVGHLMLMLLGALVYVAARPARVVAAPAAEVVV